MKTFEKPVGLTGGIASGKSTIAKMFRELGADIISGDDVAKNVLAPDSCPVKKLAERFGPEILDVDGALNREIMLNKLLANPELLRIQLQILTPFVLPAIDRKVQAIGSRKDWLVIVEAPLLFEYGGKHRYGPIITVYCTRPLQIMRLRQRLNVSCERAESIINLQIDLQHKASMSDFVIDNNSDFSNAKNQVIKISETLCLQYGINQP